MMPSTEDHFPTRPEDCPQRLIINPGFNTTRPLSRYRPLPPLALLTNIKARTGLQVCSEHAHGCGKTLECGEMLFVDGRNIYHVQGGIYYVGVFRFHYGSDRGCKVGVVRVTWDNLDMVVNRAARVGYISPDMEDDSHLGMQTNGYAHLWFVDADMESQCDPHVHLKALVAKMYQGGEPPTFATTQKNKDRVSKTRKTGKGKSIAGTS
jgi:hypothetical protein